jgi:hypothetical protein
MKNLLKTVLVTTLLVSGLATMAQVPKLNSYPSASAVLFLDCDGHTVQGTSWNVSGPIYCGATSLTNEQITTVFNRVAEDYRPFNINVTTDSTKFLAAPLNMRMRVILTVTSSWYGSAGGVAFLGSFTWGDDTPCFVFTQLLNNNVKNISEATSHELGHTLGLYHQSTYDANCVKISDYNYGQGTGEIGWAPIMGVGYYQNFTLWNSGPNSLGCNSIQSDLTVVTTTNGFTYRNDDHNSTFNQATNAPFVSNQFNVNGVIEKNTDQDLFKFTQPAFGRFTLSAIPYNVGTGNAGSNLDLQVSLFNGSQTLLNVYNPGTLLSSVIDSNLSAGTYYLRIEGKGNQYAPNYASLGSYALNGTFVGGALPLRKLELRGWANNDNHDFSWIIDADEQVVKQVLEVATDGRNFNPVAETPVGDRNYSYRPATKNTAQYRLNVTFDNGKQYYSNIVTIRSTVTEKRPFLVTNLVTGSELMINSPGNFEYLIIDMNGKTTGHGQLRTGMNLVTAQMVNGMYLIRYSNGAQQWTDKFMHQ